jgi:hypothetical protein
MTAAMVAACTSHRTADGRPDGVASGSDELAVLVDDAASRGEAEQKRAGEAGFDGAAPVRGVRTLSLSRATKKSASARLISVMQSPIPVAARAQR